MGTDQVASPTDAATSPGRSNQKRPNAVMTKKPSLIKQATRDWSVESSPRNNANESPPLQH